MIYTSYFASRKYDPEQSVSIARWAPRGYQGASIPDLYPPADLLRDYKSGAVDQKEYEQIYRERVLSRLNPDTVAKRLDGLVLLCYEKSGSFCHRHIVAAWLREHGYQCEEL